MSKQTHLLFSIAVTIVFLVSGAVLASTLTTNVVDEVQANNLDADFDDQVIAEVNESREPLQIEVVGIRSNRGKLLVLVFDNEQAFKHYDYNRAAGYQELMAESGSVTIVFPSLDNGPYAVFVMHDENGDYVLNEEDGYPIEGYSTSGARDKYDVPDFMRASVAEGKIRLKLHYL